MVCILGPDVNTKNAGELVGFILLVSLDSKEHKTSGFDPTHPGPGENNLILIFIFDVFSRL